MIRDPVARRYARALFDAASGRGLLDLVAADLKDIELLLRGSPELQRLLTTPKVDEEGKRRIIRDLFRNRVHDILVELLDLLLEKKRFGVLDQVIEDYGNLLEEHRGVVRAEVTTATEVPVAQERELIAKLEKRTGKTIRLVKRIDPSILGGMMVRIGDRIIDRSIRRGFEEMREKLLEVPLGEGRG